MRRIHGKGRLGKIRSLGVWVIVLAIVAVSESSSKPPRKASKDSPKWIELCSNIRDIPHIEESIILEQQLFDPDCVVRKKAYERLKMISSSVAQVWHNPALVYEKARLPLCQLMIEMQEETGVLPVRVNGLEFRASVDRVWQIPPSGEQRNIKLSIKVTNYADKELSLVQLGTVGFSLIDPEGKLTNIRCFTDDHFNYKSISIAKRQSSTISDFRAMLRRSKDGNELWLEGSRDSGERYHCRDLKPGIYYFWIWCGCSGVGPFDLPLSEDTWRGNVILPPIEVKIR
jgi:hypothetical protein